MQLTGETAGWGVASLFVIEKLIGVIKTMAAARKSGANGNDQVHCSTQVHEILASLSGTMAQQTVILTSMQTEQQRQARTLVAIAAHRPSAEFPD